MQQYAASAVDQFGQPMSASFGWTATGGSMSSSGMYTAGQTGGSFSVTATLTGVNGNAVVNVVPTNYPGTVADGFYVRVAPDHTTEQIWVGSAGGVGPAFGNPTYTIALANLPSLVFGPGTGGSGALTVDESNGPVTPSGGLSFDGGNGNDGLIVLGTSGDDSVTVNANQVSFGSTAITYANTESIQVDLGAGNDTLSQTAQPGSGALLSIVAPTSSDTLNISGGSFSLPAPAAGAGIMPVNLGTLSVGAGASVILNTAAAHADRMALALNSLSIAGSTGSWTGTLDLGGNDLVLHNASSAAASTAAATLADQIHSAMNAGGVMWTGNGLTSSAAKNDPNQIRSIGLLVNDDGSGGRFYGHGAPKGLFDGINASNTDVLLKSTFAGDSDLGGSINAGDYSQTDNGLSMNLTGWINGDFNYDGSVNAADYSLIDTAFAFQAVAGAPLSLAAATMPAPLPTQTPAPRSKIGVSLSDPVSIDSAAVNLGAIEVNEPIFASDSAMADHLHGLDLW
jgi:hypothetical protein